MIRPGTENLSDLYLADETAWLETHAELIREGRIDELDSAHLAEYLDDTAKSHRRELKNRLVVLLLHLLKWEYQPERRVGGWKATILTQQGELADDARTGVLRNHAEEVLPEAYKRAVKVAEAETGLAADTFPADCPFTIEQLFADDFDPDFDQ
jgi:hypothetical protein